MKKETEEWLRIAREDLLSAEHLFNASLFRMVCYHSQQAVEKSLKAILSEHNVEIPRIHNLIDLEKAVERFGYRTPLSSEEAVFLNSVYRARYPSALGLLPTGEPTKQDAERALKIAREVLRWIESKLP
jgi:HEPN domain-containing protein